jgi:hypothetical protein
MPSPRHSYFFHRDYINQFLIAPLAEGARIGDVEYSNVRRLDAEMFSDTTRKLAEHVARVFYCSAAFDKGTPPNFFEGEFTDEASLFLARIHEVIYSANSNILDITHKMHNSFVNAWLRARGHGARNDAYDALCKPWECIGSAIRRCEDVFIVLLVRDIINNDTFVTSGNYKTIAERILLNAHDTLKLLEPMLCAGLH